MKNDKKNKKESVRAEAFGLYSRVKKYYEEITYSDQRYLAFVADKALQNDEEALREISEIFSVKHKKDILKAALSIQCEAYGDVVALSEYTEIKPELPKQIWG